MKAPRAAVTGRALSFGVLCWALALVGLALTVTTAIPPNADQPHRIPLLLGVLVAYLVADSSQIHVNVRQHLLSVSLSDLPLVVGLLLLDHRWLLAMRLLSAVAVFVLQRRAVSKSAFNLCLFTMEIGLGSLLLAVLPITDATTPRQWAATYLLVLVVGSVVGLVIGLAITLLGTRLAARDLAVLLVSGWGSALLGTTLALIALLVLGTSIAGLALLTVLFVVAALSHRAYGRLLRRHTDLGQLFGFTQTVGAAQTTDEVATTLRERALELLRAESAVLLRLDAEPPPLLPDTGDVALIVARDTRDPRLRAWLTATGLKDALVVPLHDQGRIFGVLQVSNRTDKTSTFGFEDLRLLQTLAAHAELIWDKGKLVDQLRFDAHHDSLTGLGNRTHFRMALDARLAERPGSSTSDGTAVLLLDLDRFKEVNDTLGHPVGDHLLRRVAERITELVPVGSVVARLGGDEFAVLLPDGGEDGVEAARAVRAGLSQPYVVQSTHLEVGASIGVAVLGVDGEDASTVLQHADVAMYAAKRQAQGVARYAAEDDRSSVDQLAMAGDLRRGLESGQVEMHLQPQSHPSGRPLVSFEALARWHHPTRGLVMPDDFIPLAEQTGLINQLTYVALRGALTACASWQSRWPDVGVAVNLSPRQLLDPELPPAVAALLQQHPVAPRLLTLEITEGSLLLDSAAAARALAQLRELGVRLSIDDFGTGYSALAYLQRLPIDELKIDKSFVLAMTTDDSARAIVRAIIDLAHTLGLSVVAEGVEDEAARALLAGFGCDVLQGYWLSRPLSPQALPAWLRQHQGGSAVVG
ncbi:MAG: sensor domain-containing phosphodiesterase [Actinomycetota bacterium]